VIAVKDAVELEELLNMKGRDLLETIKRRDDGSELITRIWAASRQAHETKSLQKLAKKALYVLRSGGVDVDRHRPAQKKSDKGAKRERLETALLSVPDGLGFSQLVIAMLNESSAALTLYRFVIHTLHGVNQFSSVRGSRKLLQELGEDVHHFTIPAPYALYRLDRVLKKTDREKVSGLNALPRELLSGQGRVEHPVFEEVRSRLNRIRKPAEERELFSLEEIGGMALPQEDIAVFRDQIEKARESRLVVQGMTPEERVHSVMQRFYRSYFTPERLEDLSLRLLDTALSFQCRGMKEYALLLIEYAERLLSPNLTAEKHPLLGYLTYKAIMNR
jgi:hypothetical protein